MDKKMKVGLKAGSMTGLFFSTLITILFVSFYDRTFYMIFVVFSITMLYGIISGGIMSVIDKKSSISFLKKGIFSMIIMNSIMIVVSIIFKEGVYPDWSSLIIASIIWGVLLGHNYEIYMNASTN